jgi:excisionase family DNA binding protein
MMLMNIQIWAVITDSGCADARPNRSDPNDFPPMLRNSKSGQKHGKVLKLRDAALRLGVSFPMIKQWIYKKKIRSLQMARGHHRIPQSGIDGFLFRTRGRTEMDRKQALRRVSAVTNWWVDAVRVSGLMAEGMISIGRQQITSIITYYGTLGPGNVAQARADCCGSRESYRSDDSASVR